MKVYISCRYNSSKSKYKGRGFHQLTGKQDDTGLYNEPGPYEKYAEFVENKKIVEQPDIVCTQIHYAIDSAGWFWTNKESGKTIPNWSSSSQKEYIKFRAEHFSKALGKPLNEVSHLVEEDEKYYWLQAKLLNGYPKGQKLETNPIGWNIREKAFKILKNEVFEFDKLCKGDKELEFSIKERAPWINIAILEYNKYKNYFNPDSIIQSRIKEYCSPNKPYYTLWCAAFVHWCFQEAGYSKIHSGNWLGAYQFKSENWKEGESCEAFVGAVIVFNFSHVAFIIGQTKDKNKYVYLGGNQGGSAGKRSISVNAISKTSNTFWITKPKSYIISKEEKELPLLEASGKDLTYDDTH